MTQYLEKETVKNHHQTSTRRRAERSREISHSTILVLTCPYRLHEDLCSCKLISHILKIYTKYIVERSIN